MTDEDFAAELSALYDLTDDVFAASGRLPIEDSVDVLRKTPAGTFAPAQHPEMRGH